MLYGNAHAGIVSREVITRTGIFETTYQRRWWGRKDKQVTKEKVLVEYRCIAPGGLPVVKYDWEWERV